MSTKHLRSNLRGIKARAHEAALEAERKAKLERFKKENQEEHPSTVINVYGEDVSGLGALLRTIVKDVVREVVREELTNALSGLSVSINMAPMIQEKVEEKIEENVLEQVYQEAAAVIEKEAVGSKVFNTDDIEDSSLVTPKGQLRWKHPLHTEEAVLFMVMDHAVRDGININKAGQFVEYCGPAYQRALKLFGDWQKVLEAYINSK